MTFGSDTKDRISKFSQKWNFLPDTKWLTQILAIKTETRQSYLTLAGKATD